MNMEKNMNRNNINRIIKTIKVCILLLILITNNMFAAVVSDNDGSAFITKAEFDSLKNDFQLQINNYNISIDSKIDNAITSYLTGITTAKESTYNILSYQDEIYCMKYKSDTETKDLRYVHDWPYVTARLVGWCYWTDYSATYGWDFTLKPIKTESAKNGDAVGERNLISNTVDKTSTFGGCAEWIGHVNNVYEKQSWSMTDINKVIYGWHFANTAYDECGLTSSDPIYNKAVGGTNWPNGGIWLEPDNFYRGYSGLNNLSDAYVTSIELVRGNTSKLTNSKMIIFKPETYYAFTENDRDRFFEFDANSISGFDTSKTYAPVLYLANSKTGTSTNYKRVSGITSAPSIFSQLSGNRSYYQSNIGYGSGSRTFTFTSYTNWTSSQTAYEKTNKRYLYPVKGFPWQSIDNWNKLYLVDNDWAAKTIGRGNTSVLSPDDNTYHLSLNGGWPIYYVKKDAEYEYKVSFKENSNHLVFGKLEPFNTDNVLNEDTITWDTSVLLNGSYKNAAKVEAGKTVTLKFKANKDGILFLKWCDEPASTTTALDGGGTIKLEKTIFEKAG